jgi:hypothetical protein
MFASLNTDFMSVSAKTKEVSLGWLDVLQEQVESLKFGIVQIVVHDRRVVQIERTEKFRFDRPDNGERTGNRED